MKYAIIEDQEHTVTMISSIVADSFSDFVFCGTASTINKGISLLKKEKPDFVFLDVHLNDGESFQILQEFPSPNFKIIFVTSYSKFAVNAFNFSAIDFVLKPFTSNDITNAIEKVLANNKADLYQEKLAAFFHNYTSSQQKIVLSNADNIHIVPLENILFAKSDNNYTTFYINDGREILISKPLKHFEEKLSNSFFFRTHQKYLINLNQIVRYNKRHDTIILSNNNSIPVSQSKKASLLQFLTM